MGRNPAMWTLLRKLTFKPTTNQRFSRLTIQIVCIYFHTKILFIPFIDAKI